MDLVQIQTKSQNTTAVRITINAMVWNISCRDQSLVFLIRVHSLEIYNLRKGKSTECDSGYHRPDYKYLSSQWYRMSFFQTVLKKGFNSQHWSSQPCFDIGSNSRRSEQEGKERRESQHLGTAGSAGCHTTEIWKIRHMKIFVTFKAVYTYD